MRAAALVVLALVDAFAPPQRAVKPSIILHGSKVGVYYGTEGQNTEAAADMLERDFGVAADIWSLTSVNELARDGNDAVRWNRLHPTEAPRAPYLTAQLSETKGPFIAATDYQKAHTDQLRQFIPGHFTVLGTDGFGRSDTRRQLRQHFEVSREHIVLATLTALVDEGELDISIVERAISELEINTDKPNPMRL